MRLEIGVGAVEKIEERKRAAPAKFIDGLGDAGERRPKQIDDGHAVETHKREIGGDRNALGARLHHDAKGYGIAPREDGAWPVLAREDALCCLEGGPHFIFGADAPVIFRRDARFEKGAAPAAARSVALITSRGPPMWRMSRWPSSSNCRVAA